MTGLLDYSGTAASNLAVGGVSIAEGMARAGVNNAIRAFMADIAKYLLDLGGAVATTGSANAYLLTLNSVPTAYANNMFFAATANHSNSGAATINVNSLGLKDIEKIVNGAAAALASGDFPSGHIGLFTYSSGNSSVVLLNPAIPAGAIATSLLTTRGDLIRRGASVAERVALGASGTVLKSDGTDAVWGQPDIGLQTIFIPAAAITSRTTNGAAAGSAEKTTNKNMFVSKDFDTTTQEFGQFSFMFPESWDEGTVTFAPVWSHPVTTVNFGVAFGLAGVAISNDDVGDVAFGTAQTSVDTGGTTDDIYVGPTSSAITIAGTPAAGDWTMFQLNRTVADAGDTLAVDARLHGIKLLYTVVALKDAS